MEKYILKYLQDSTQDEWRKRYYDYMKLVLDPYFWSNGNHLSNNLEYERLYEEYKRLYEENIIIPRRGMRKNIYMRLKRMVKKKLLKIIKKFSKQPTKTETKQEDAKLQLEFKYTVLSLFGRPYLTSEVVKSLNDFGIGVDIIYDTDKVWSKSTQRLIAWKANTKNLNFNELVKEKYVLELKDAYNALLDVFRKTDYDAVLVHTAELFETKIFIDVFRDLGKISIELIHGVPGTSSRIEDRVDFLLVYGEKIRKNCIISGYNPQKVLVAGNSKYLGQPVQNPSSLRCYYEDILVLTSAPFAGHQHDWEFEMFPIFDRSLLITYLYSVENVLKKNGISHARLRPHPSVSKEWLAGYVDMDFYELDYLPINLSLEQATCCIGQNSTTVFEAIQSGVSYMVYEPGDGSFSMTGSLLVPPFDGSDSFLRIANTEEQLDEMIQSHYCPDIKILSEYFESFKPKVILDILSKQMKK